MEQVGLSWMDVLKFVGPFSVFLLVMVFLLIRYAPGKGDRKLETQQIEFNHSILDRLTQIEDENRTLRHRIAQLERENYTLLHNIALLESAHQDLPLPMWLKDKDGRMLAVNLAYEKSFLQPIGKTRQDYINQTDFDIWPDEVAERYRSHDRTVMNTGEPLYFREEMQLNDEVEPVMVLKYPRSVAGIVVGVAGIALPCNKVESCSATKVKG